MDPLAEFGNRANEYFERGDVRNAFNCYLIFLKGCPEMKPVLKEKFLTVLCVYGDLLERNGQLAELFECYQNSLEIFNDCAALLCNLGAHLHRCGYHSTAYRYFVEALERDRNYVPARRNLQNVANCILERWHFRMLNDNNRNESYRQAIFNRIDQNYRDVLDIGVGTGLLSIYATQRNAASIYACDYNKEMVLIATEIIRKNGLNNRMVLINKISTDLKIPSDIPKRVSLMVTETMDCGLFGENLLRTISHAWDNLLLPPLNNVSSRTESESCAQIPPNDGNHGIVIPFGGSLFVSGVECFSFARKYYYPTTECFAIDCLDQFEKISVTNDADSIRLTSLRDDFMKDKYYRADLDRFYDSHRLRKPHYKFLTEEHQLCYINFNNIKDVKDTVEGRISHKTFSLTCSESGYLHALAVWFAVLLDENNRLDSSPTNENYDSCCWDQAMIPLQQLIPVTVGCKIMIILSWADGKLSATILDQYCYMPKKVIYLRDSLPQDVIITLNDPDLMKHCDDVVVTFGSMYKSSQTVYILDLFPLPIFGLNILRYSNVTSTAVGEHQATSVKLFCVVQDERVKTFMQYFIQRNNIPEQNIEYLTEERYYEICASGQPFFDIIVTNLIGSDGDLNDHAVSQVSILRTVLKPGGIFYPESITVQCQLIQSNWLRNTSKVTNQNIESLHIPEVLNYLKTSHCLELDLCSIDYKPLCNIFHWPEIKSDQLNEQFQIDNQFIHITTNGSLTAICYWFGINFAGKSYITLSDHSYTSQAAFILETDYNVNVNDIFALKLNYYKGMFRIFVDFFCN